MECMSESTVNVTIYLIKLAAPKWAHLKTQDFNNFYIFSPPESDCADLTFLQASQVTGMEVDELEVNNMMENPHLLDNFLADPPPSPTFNPSGSPAAIGPPPEPAFSPPSSPTTDLVICAPEDELLSEARSSTPLPLEEAASASKVPPSGIILYEDVRNYSQEQKDALNKKIATKHQRSAQYVSKNKSKARDSNKVVEI